MKQLVVALMLGGVGMASATPVKVLAKGVRTVEAEGPVIMLARLDGKTIVLVNITNGHTATAKVAPFLGDPSLLDVSLAEAGVSNPAHVLSETHYLVDMTDDRVICRYWSFIETATGSEEVIAIEKTSRAPLSFAVTVKDTSLAHATVQHFTRGEKSCSFTPPPEQDLEL